MISFVKKRALLLIVVVYIMLLLLAGLAEDIELYVVLFTLIYSLFVVLPWVIWQFVKLYRLKKEVKQTELLHLKSQVNPHFFFNTLNLLYGTIEKDREEARALVLKLSDLMRYSIYNAQKELVTLEEEVDYLERYIELQKARFQRKIDISFKVDIEEKGVSVMPLLFIILVENAFKHGAENLRENAYIRMSITTTKNKISFHIENNTDPEIKAESGGLGLQNLRRRLELGYPGRHDFSENRNQNIYQADLILKTG